MHIMSTLFFVVIGCIVGSFLNVVVYRFRSQEGGIIDGQSHCRSCGENLTWRDNIPIISYLMLRGSCRACDEKISLQYPLVEAFTGLLFGLIAYFLIGSLFDGAGITAGLLTMAVFAALTVILVYDYKYMEVPMITIWIGVFFAVVLLLVKDVVFADFLAQGFFGTALFSHGMAGAVAFLFFFSLSYVSDEKWMGYGDGYIALVIGLLLGPASTFLAMLLAVWSGAFIGIFLACMGGKSMKTAIPFGPFLVLGAISAFIVTHALPAWSQLFW